MQRAGDEFLSRAVLAGDEHPCRRFSYAIDLIAHGANAVRPSNDLVSRLNRLTQPGVLGEQIEVLQRVAQRDENAVGVERLLENVVCAQLRGFDGGLNRRVSADHDDDRARIALLDLLERLDAVDAGHLHIEEDEIRPLLGVFRQTVHGISDRAHLVTLELEQLPECGADALLVVDDQNATRHDYFTFLYRVTFPFAIRMSLTYPGIGNGSASLLSPAGRLSMVDLLNEPRNHRLRKGDAADLGRSCTSNSPRPGLSIWKVPGELDHLAVAKHARQRPKFAAHRREVDARAHR